MKKITIFITTILLSGCAIDMSRDNELNYINGISYKQKGEYEYIKQYKKIYYNSDASMEKIKICALRNVTNRDVNLNDSSKSFVGSYTGNYYNINSSSKVSGGDVVSLSGEKTLVINGSTGYAFDSGIISVNRVVRFTLDILNADKTLEYTFSNIQQAQTETGYLPNDGFNDIGTWKGAAAAQAVKSLEDVTKNIDDCLKI
ncbi:hypothetical protein [Brenneria goodwinii]|uniref:hypothetical protein n=1 Tax=Brenneria goodwinii TaxID=1109412 RepID=UPI0011AB6075|nr:hypothetical protein [Brenneria goodwinii]